MTLFDHFYEPVPVGLEQQYDFITATEVVEHLHDPKKELERLWACLKQGGWLGIMTNTVVDQDAFTQWYYKNDLTHVCFFSRTTFAWLALQWHAEVVFADSDVVLFYKKPVSSTSTQVGTGKEY
jgi:2-polyprenyl-3-methyl-5-hydroxy-6-metoxy-1,4-benzoquinol methylase